MKSFDPFRVSDILLSGVHVGPVVFLVMTRSGTVLLMKLLLGQPLDS